MLNQTHPGKSEGVASADVTALIVKAELGYELEMDTAAPMTSSSD